MSERRFRFSPAPIYFRQRESWRRPPWGTVPQRKPCLGRGLSFGTTSEKIGRRQNAIRRERRQLADLDSCGGIGRSRLAKIIARDPCPASAGRSFWARATKAP